MKCKKIHLNESQYLKLLSENGGIHPDGQIDLFYNQDEVDKFHKQSNEKMFKALIDAEHECGYGHNVVKQHNAFKEYICFPIIYNADRKWFIETLKDYVPSSNNLKVKISRNPYDKNVYVLIKNV